MLYLVALFLAAIFAWIVWDHLQKPKRLKKRQEEDARRQAEVARRGWTLDIQRERRNALFTYRGTTEGIPWTCEMSSWTSGPNIDSGTQTRVFTRWSSEQPVLRDGILAFWPAFGAGQQAAGPQVPQFVLNLLLAPLIKALGGKGGDASLLAQATPVVTEDAVLSKAWLLRATDPRAMHRLLEAGGREALAEAASWLPVRDNPHHLTIAAIWQPGLSIVIAGWVDEISEIERISAFGARLARAYDSMNS